jgi:predicted DNA-binding protein
MADKEQDKKIRTNVFLTEKQRERMKLRSESIGISMSQQIRKAVDWYLDDVEMG